MKIGYVYSALDNAYIKEQIDALRRERIKQIIVDEEEIDELEKGDELIIYELSSLGKSITQLPSLFAKLEKKGVKLVILNKGKAFEAITDKQYIAFLLDVAANESFIISDRTTKGIQQAKRSGRIGGRPKISPETIEKIRYLYNTQGYTLRKISETCEVSLGTAYKYIQE